MGEGTGGFRRTHTDVRTVLPGEVLGWGEGCRDNTTIAQSHEWNQTLQKERFGQIYLLL